MQVHLSVFILAVRCFLDIYILQMPAGSMNSSLTENIPTFGAWIQMLECCQSILQSPVMLM